MAGFFLICKREYLSFVGGCSSSHSADILGCHVVEDVAQFRCCLLFYEQILGIGGGIAENKVLGGRASNPHRTT